MLPRGVRRLDPTTDHKSQRSSRSRQERLRIGEDKPETSCIYLGNRRVGVGSIRGAVVEPAGWTRTTATAGSAAGELAPKPGVGVGGGLLVVLDDIVEGHVQSTRHV